MVKQHTKRSVNWRQDPEILQRLELVANLMLQGAKTPQMVAALGSSTRTVARDIARVRELWRKASEQTIDDRRAASLASYAEIKTRLWEEFRRLKAQDKSVIGVLAEITKVEGEITKIEGTRILNVDVTTKGDKITDPRGWSDDELATILSTAQS
jgi:hypothetical protein